jgi:hypothetical protein
LNFFFSPIILFLLSNVDSQRLGIIIQHNTSVEIDSVLEILKGFEFNIAKALKLIRFLVLYQANILDDLLAKDLDYVALHDSLWKVPDKCDERRIGREWLLALLIVISKIIYLN